jgi:hypothetical protein
MVFFRDAMGSKTRCTEALECTGNSMMEVSLRRARDPLVFFRRPNPALTGGAPHIDSAKATPLA